MVRRSARLSSRKSGELPTIKPEDENMNDSLVETSVDESEFEEDHKRRGRKPAQKRGARKTVPKTTSAASSSFKASKKDKSGADDEFNDANVSESSQEIEDDTKTGEKRARKPAQVRSKKKNTSRVTRFTSSLGENKISHGIENLGLDNLAIELDDSTHILNRFVAFIKDNNVHTDKPAVYTPNFDKAEHVLDMPFFDPDHRHFELMVENVALYDHEPAIGDTYRAWRLSARNLREPDSEPVELFQLHTSIRDNERCIQCKGDSNHMAYCNVQDGVACDNCVEFRDPAECIRKFNILQERGYAFLTEDVCNEEELDLMISLGHIKVDVMNRVPMSLNLDTWKRINIKGGRPAPVPHARVFIDILSLIIWKQHHVPELDLEDLGWKMNDAWQTIWSRFCYGRGRAPFHSATSVLRQHPPACLVTDSPGQEPNFTAAKNLKYLVSYKGIDIKKADELEDLKTYAVFTLEERDSEDNQKRAATRVLEHIMFTTAGLIGSAQSLRNIANTKRREFLSVDEQEATGALVTRGHFGPYNGKFIWARPAVKQDSRWTSMKVATAVYRDVIVDDGTTLHQGMGFNTIIRDRACLAFIQQESLNALARDENLIQAIFAAQVAAQYLELGILTKTDVLRQYCVCTSAEMQAVTEHLCMTCGLSGPCSNMALQEIPDGLLMECFGCSRRNTSAERAFIMTAENMIKTRVARQYRKDGERHHPPWTKAELFKALVDTYLVDGDPNVWKDAYSEQTVAMDDAKFTPEANVDVRLVYRHPYSMSIEKPFNRWLRSDGKIALHDPDNAVLTKVCINRLKEFSAPSVLPLLKKALQLRMAVASKPPCAGYDSSVAADWAVLERVSNSRYSY
jgi:hypothetical protein